MIDAHLDPPIIGRPPTSLARRCPLRTNGFMAIGVALMLPAVLPLAARSTRPELEPRHDAEGYDQQPWGEQQVEREAEHRQRHDGEEGNDDDPKHVDRSPFTMD